LRPYPKRRDEDLNAPSVERVLAQVEELDASAFVSQEAGQHPPASKFKPPVVAQHERLELACEQECAEERLERLFGERGSGEVESAETEPEGEDVGESVDDEAREGERRQVERPRCRRKGSGGLQ
jgi:hypothetical protein